MRSEALSRRSSRTIAIVAGVAAFYYALFGGEYSAADLADLEERAADRAARLATFEAELDSLATWGDSLATDPWVIERVARQRHGFLRDGETVFRFVELEPAASDPASP